MSNNFDQYFNVFYICFNQNIFFLMHSDLGLGFLYSDLQSLGHSSHLLTLPCLSVSLSWSVGIHSLWTVFTFFAKNCYHSACILAVWVLLFQFSRVRKCTGDSFIHCNQSLLFWFLPWNARFCGPLLCWSTCIG